LIRVRAAEPLKQLVDRGYSMSEIIGADP